MSPPLDFLRARSRALCERLSGEESTRWRWGLFRLKRAQVIRAEQDGVLIHGELRSHESIDDGTCVSGRFDFTWLAGGGPKFRMSSTYLGHDLLQKLGAQDVETFLSPLFDKKIVVKAQKPRSLTGLWDEQLADRFANLAQGTLISDGRKLRLKLVDLSRSNEDTASLIRTVANLAAPAKHRLETLGASLDCRFRPASGAFSRRVPPALAFAGDVVVTTSWRKDRMLAVLRGRAPIASRGTYDLKKNASDSLPPAISASASDLGPATVSLFSRGVDIEWPIEDVTAQRVQTGIFLFRTLSRVQGQGPYR